MAVTEPAAPFLSDGQLESFVQKLAQFRWTLSQPEQRVLDAMLAAGATDEDEADVQGYMFSQDALARRAAVAVVVRLSRTVGRLQPSPHGLVQRLAHHR